MASSSTFTTSTSNATGNVYNAGEFYGLYKVFHSFIHNPQAFQDEVTALFQQNREHIRNPLRFRGRDAQTRTQLNNAARTGSEIDLNGKRLSRVTQDFINQVLIFSDETHINELDSLQLFVYAYSEKDKLPSMEIPALVKWIYYTDRDSLIKLICSILIWEVDSADDIRHKVVKNVASWINYDFISHIINLLSEDINTPSRTLTPHDYSSLHLRDENINLGRCLFFCLYFKSADAVVMDRFLKLYSNVVTKWRLDPNGSCLRELCIFLMLGILQTFFALDNEENASIDARWVANFNREVTRLGLSDFHGVLNLGWALFLLRTQIRGAREEHNPSTLIEMTILANNCNLSGTPLPSNTPTTPSLNAPENASNTLDVFGFLKCILESDSYKELFKGDYSDNYFMFTNVLDTLLENFLGDSYDPPSLFQKDTPKFRHCVGLFQFITVLYKSRPDLANKFWAPATALLLTDSRASLSSSMGSMTVDQSVVQSNLISYLGKCINSITDTLFSPFIKMVSSLASSPKGALSAYHFFSRTPRFNWTTFFRSLKGYSEDLSQSDPTYNPSQNGGSVITQIQPKRFRPNEEEGFYSILLLVSTIVKYSDTVRSMIADNSMWNPFVILGTLLACTIPTRLKGITAQAIAAFARSSRFVIQIWDIIEKKYILVPPVNLLSSTPTQYTIKYELEEVESFEREYPYTIGFLSILFELSRFSIPDSVGMAGRTDKTPFGFEPYLNFVRDNVFLKFNSRSYKSIEEGWKICSLCLGIFYRLLQNYNFVSQSNEVDKIAYFNSPGYFLMRDILNGAPTLQKMLEILSQASKTLQLERETPGGIYFESAVLLVMRIFEIVVLKEQEFLNAFYKLTPTRATQSLALSRQPPISQNVPTLIPLTSNPIVPLNQQQTKSVTTTLSLTPLHQQLMSRDTSVFVTFALLVDYELSNSIPHAALRLLYLFSKDVKLPTIFLQSRRELEILRIFVARLNKEESFINYDDGLQGDFEELKYDESDRDSFVFGFEVEEKKSLGHSILNLILTNLEHPAPNLAHFFLGFNIGSPNLERTMLSSNTSTSLLHIILKNITDSYQTLHIHSEILEQCYEVIYTLASNSQTSKYLIAHLRGIHFFIEQANVIDFKVDFIDFTNSTLSQDKIENMRISRLYQKSWLMRLLALELHLLGEVFEKPEIDENLKSYTQDLLNHLFGLTAFNTIQDQDENMIEIRKVLSALDFLDLPSIQVTPLSNRLIPNPSYSLFVHKNRRNNIEISLTQLTKSLISERHKLGWQFAAVDSQQTSEVDREIKNTIKNAIQLNLWHEWSMAMQHTFQGWTQLIGSSLFRSYPALVNWERIPALLDILNDSIKRMVDEYNYNWAKVDPKSLDNSSSLNNSFSIGLSEIISLTTTRIRSECDSNYTFTASVPSVSDPTSTNSFFDKGLTGVTNALDVVRNQPVAIMSSILEGIVNGILKHGTTYLVRGNLYSALMQYLRICKKLDPISNNGTDEDNLEFAERREAQQKLDTANFLFLQSTGERLIQIVCNDATTSPQLWQALAYSVLATLIPFDYRQQYRWTRYIETKHLSNFTSDIVTNKLSSFIELLSGTESKGEKDKSNKKRGSLFLFESKMSFFLTMAQYELGARAFYETGVLRAFINCDPIDYIPDPTAEEITHENYEMVLLPILRFVSRIQTTLQDNVEIGKLTAGFLIAHQEAFEQILADKGRAGEITIGSLEKITLVSSILAHSSEYLNRDVVDKMNTSAKKYQTLMLSLLVKYSNPDRWVPLVRHGRVPGKKPPTQPNTHMLVDSPFSILSKEEQKQVTLGVLNTLANILTYCRSNMGLLLHSGNLTVEDMGNNTPRLFPCFTHRFTVLENETPFAVKPSTPSLGIIVEILNHALSAYKSNISQKEKVLYSLSRPADFQLLNTPSTPLHQISLLIPNYTLTINEIGEVLKVDADEISNLPIGEQTVLVKKYFSTLLSNLDEFLNSLFYIIENALFLLWSHIEHYITGSEGLQALTRQQLNEFTTQVKQALIQSPNINSEGLLNQISSLQPAANISKSKTKPSIILSLVRRIKELVRETQQ